MNSSMLINKSYGSMNIDFYFENIYYFVKERRERSNRRECELRVNFFFKHRRNFQC